MEEHFLVDRTEDVYEKYRKSLPDLIISEYQAMREEILFRLKFQENIINYSFILLGLLAPALSLLEIGSLSVEGLLLAILVGPLVAVFLQSIYLKQYIYFQQLAHYIKTTLGKEISEKNVPPLAGWEYYLDTVEIEPKGRLSFILGATEGGFSLLVGAVYVFVTALFMFSNDVEFGEAHIALLVLGILGLIISVGMTFKVRAWGQQLRLGGMESLRIRKKSGEEI